MGLPDTSLTDLVVKFKSWISWRGNDLTPSSFSAAFEMPNNDLKMCCDCNSSFSGFLNGFNCQCCGRWLCVNCADGFESGVDVIDSERDSLKSCKFCKFGVKSQGGRKINEKVHPTESPRHSPEAHSPCFSVDSIHSDRHGHYLESKDCGFSSIGVTSWSASSFSPHRSSLSLHRSPSRSDEGEAEEPGNHFYCPSSEYCHDMSDVDSSSLSARFELYNCKSVGSSPLDSPSRIDFNSYRAGHFVQQGQESKQLSLNDGSFGQENLAILRRPDKETEDPQHTDDHSCNFQYDKAQKLLDFESNGRIWLPPPPEDENDEAESNLFAYDDDDDDIGDSGAIFSSTSSLSAMFPLKEKQNECNKEPLKAVIQGHFRALVLQLLQGEGMKTSKEGSDDDWLDIVTTIALQAANFVKPDTRRGGSMDPVDYVKVKCIASGSPSDSTLVKGVVCTKNIKHKRMTTQYRHPRLLLLGGALENQSVVNHLASFNTLVQQENDHLKMIIAKIEALRPNVLLVEKSVSPYAQEYLLAKDISLVLNVKRPLLERIAQCTSAFISPSIDNISTTRLGNCELFRVERVIEEHEATNQFNRKPSKTLMFFEGCPRRLGCTVLLRGSCREELKKVKDVVQYAVFAAYHLSLETSFLSDEGATLPKMTLKPSISKPELSAPDSTLVDEGPAILKPEHDDLLTSLSPFLPNSTDCTSENTFSDVFHDDQLDSFAEEEIQVTRNHESAKSARNDEDEISSEYFSATDTNQSILVSFSSRCVLKGTICERSRLLRIKFYGSFDKPLGRYLRDDLFDKTSYCGSCKEPAEAHVLCYTHRQGNLTINVRSLTSVKLPGEKDGKIWMWHRCLRCAHIDGVPPPTLRVVMSDAAWGLSFGKFLELSFSNHATANRVAPCGHSLQRDCLRFYGFGSMVAFFRYSPIDILSVHLPPPVLEFNGHVQQEWIKKEADELLGNMETFYSEISDVLDSMEEKSKCFGSEMSDLNELQNHIMELKDQLRMERNDCCGALQVAVEGTSLVDQRSLDILELNNLRRALIIGSHVWDRQLYSLDSLLKTNSVVKAIHCEKELRTVTSVIKDLKLDYGDNDLLSENKKEDEHLSNGEITDNPSKPSSLSDRIDSAWSGTDQLMTSIQPPFKRLLAPVRVNSFDSALRVQDRIRKGLPPSSLYLSTLKSFHASGDYRNMVRDPVPRAMRTYSQTLPMEGQKLNLMHSSAPPLFISSASQISGGARLLLPRRTPDGIVIGVFDNDPASIVSYALCSKEYDDWVSDKSGGNDALCSGNSTLSAWQPFGSSDLEYIRSGSFVSEDPSPSISTLFFDSNKSLHLTISFADDGGSKVKFSVTCYFAKEFEALRKKCCPSEVDFIQSLSRCERWNAQGGKSNVYFAKSLDERFILKQVKKTELDSFEEFASDYFKYLTDSLSCGSPTCLAKVLGIYQVTVKHLKGGKEMKMDVIVMENLFYQRSISRVYDLKGSSRSRYNPDTTGANKVLLDSNLVETLRMEPLFLGSKAKRSLERAIWNDTSFLASVDVMDYSLLVGIDNERKELVLGIIDFMRQYTWDKHLETWVKASGILGGPNNASPTIISPKQYKKRFRKAMTSYFLTVPDQWSC